MEAFKLFTAKKTFCSSLGTIRLYSEYDGMTIGSGEDNTETLLDAVRYLHSRRKHFEDKYKDLRTRLDKAGFLLTEEVSEYDGDDRL